MKFLLFVVWGGDKSKFNTSIISGNINWGLWAVVVGWMGLWVVDVCWGCGLGCGLSFGGCRLRLWIVLSVQLGCSWGGVGIVDGVCNCDCV
jgi:hypothetical protein